MNEWVEMKLGEIGNFKSSGVDKVIKPEEKIVRLVNYMDVYNSVKIDNSFYLSETSATQHEIDSFGLKKGDVLFTPTSETPDDIGHSSVVIEDLQNAVYSYHLTRFREFSEKLLDDEFKAYIFNHYFVLHQFEKKAAGSTRFTLTRGSFESTIVRFTKDLKIQRKIARILSTADAVIEKTQSAIAKYKAIKQGMLHDLFTRGIDPATGKLRPTYEDAPELYKKSKLGWIPKDWEDLTFKDICIINQGLQIPISSRFKSEGKNRYVYITIQYLNNIEDESYRYFIESPPESVICYEDDILMTRTGNTGKVVSNIIGVFHNNFFKVDYKRNNNKKYIINHLEREEIQNLIMNYAGTTTIPDLKHSDFYKLPFFKPQIKEQDHIGNRIRTINQKLQTEQTYLHKLQQIKAGLMADLLSGKKKVNIEEEPVN